MSADVLRAAFGAGGFTPTCTGLLVPTGFLAPRNKPIAIDLFAGAGGFSLGFTQGGFHVAAACEHDYWAMQTYLLNLGGPQTVIRALDPEARQTIDTAIAKDARKTTRTLEDGHSLVAQPDGTYRMPLAGSAWRSTQPDIAPCEAYYFGDVRALGGTQVLADLHLDRGALDAIIGGPPCQGFSNAGQRNVMDPRNSLVFEYARLVVELQPKTFVLENVVGIASMVTPEGLSVLDAFCLALSKGGYSTYEALKRSMGITSTGRAGTSGHVSVGKIAPADNEEEPAVMATPVVETPVQASLF